MNLKKQLIRVLQYRKIREMKETQVLENIFPDISGSLKWV